MKKYIGTKQIEAEPMTMGEAFIEGFLQRDKIPSDEEKSKKAITSNIKMDMRAGPP